MLNLLDHITRRGRVEKLRRRLDEADGVERGAYVAATVDLALAAFWAAVYARFPRIDGADCQAELSLRLDDAADRAVRSWIAENVLRPMPKEAM